MRAERILIVDDEKLLRWSIASHLTQLGFQVEQADSLAAADTVLQELEPDLILLDQILEDGAGVDFLAQLSHSMPHIAVIMVTAVDRSDIAVRAMKLGAFDYVTKPLNLDELEVIIERTLNVTRFRRQVEYITHRDVTERSFHGMMGQHPAIRAVFDQVSRIAQSGTTTALIIGESGTGKELVARAIHQLSPRATENMLTINCGAIPESLMESELFGHEKGAFTDARAQRKGVFELADKGTVFLDEIGNISPSIQAALLRVLENRSFLRIGGSHEITVDVRFIAATNKPLQQLAAEGKFREDLFYRLNVGMIHVPPLRDRGRDALLLADMFLEEFNGVFNKQFKGISEGTRRLFMHHDWPGNVRELRNVLERAVLLQDGDIIDISSIEHVRQSNVHPPDHSGIDTQTIQDESLEDMEKGAIMTALERAGNNQSEAARILKISRDTLRYRMKKWRISGS
ncbi:MAG: sigma-54-dependent Fis family transcriptional regulator [Bacteroidetes bacterium]|nr:sigma-54-dependent Fis family transcriptional regulator [Bacteroidota bacterium]